MSRYATYTIVSLILIVVQTTVLRLLMIQGISPDLLLIWIVYLALKEGQVSGTAWGFALGLVFDLTTGSFIGLSALTKTIGGFSAGYFFNENKTGLTLGSYRFPLIVLSTSAIHNTLYFIIFMQGTEIGALKAVFSYGFTTSFFTTAIALIPMLWFERKYRV